MQRVAVIYDIHGHLPALEAVLQEICQDRAEVGVKEKDERDSKDANDIEDRSLVTVP